MSFQFEQPLHGVRVTLDELLPTPEAKEAFEKATAALQAPQPEPVVVETIVVETVVEPVVVETVVVEPVKVKRKGPNAGVTKEMKPRLSNRLPREKGGIIAPMGDGMTPFERAVRRLGNRVKATKTYYTLDGKPCSALDILALAETLK